MAARQQTLRWGGFRSLLEVKWPGIEHALNLVWEKGIARVTPTFLELDKVNGRSDLGRKIKSSILHYFFKLEEPLYSGLPGWLRW